MTIKMGNNATAHLAAPLGVADTTLVLASGEVGHFPALTSETHPLTLMTSSGALEIVTVTARSANVLAIVRAQEGTTALAFAAGDLAEIRMTAGVVDTLQAATAAVQSNVDSLSASTSSAISSINTTLATKAAQSSLDALTTTVSGKLDTASTGYARAAGGTLQLDVTSGKAVMSKNGTGIGTVATESYADSAAATAAAGVQSVPSGAILPYAGATAPAGWLLCYGQAVARTTYAALFAAIGTAHGAGDGSTTFNLPDLRGRVAAGKDDMGGTAAGRLTTGGSGVDGTLAGAAGGAQTHTLTTAQMPNHTHAITYDGTTGASTNNRVLTTSGANGVGTLTTGAAGTGGAHNNVQPTIVLNYIIRT